MENHLELYNNINPLRNLEWIWMFCIRFGILNIVSNNIIISDLMFGKREEEGIPLYSLQQAEMIIYI